MVRLVGYLAHPEMHSGAENGPAIRQTRVGTGGQDHNFRWHRTRAPSAGACNAGDENRTRIRRLTRVITT